MRAISSFSFEVGTSTRSSRARTPFRIRVIMSAMGSVMFIGLPLPARLDHAGDVAGQRQLAEADAAHLELPDVGPGAAAGAAAVVLAHPELRLPLGLGNERQLRHYPYLLTGCGTACRGRRAGPCSPRPCGPWSRRSRSFRGACRPWRSRSPETGSGP